MVSFHYNGNSEKHNGAIGPFHNPTVDLTWIAAGAISSTLLTYRIAKPESELWSEVLCWISIFVWSRSRRTDSALQSLYDISKCLLWIAAAGIATSTLCGSMINVRWILPFLTPLLLALRDFELKFCPPPFNRQAPWYVGSIWVHIVLACLSLAAVASIDYFTVVISCISLLGSTALYVALIKISESRGAMENAAHGSLARMLPARTVPLLLFVALLLKHTDAHRGVLDLSNVAMVAVLKFVHWVCMLQLTPYAPWELATTILSFSSIASTPITPYAPLFPLLLDVLIRTTTSFANLLQVMALLPSSRRRRVLIIFALWPICSILRCFPFLDVSPSGLRGAEHPVELLIRDAQAKFAVLQSRQSKTQEEAITEYKRRYSRPPPPGFSQWYTFATRNAAPLIDEYDQILSDLTPFFSLSPSRMRKDIHYLTEGEHSESEFSNVAWKDGKYVGDDCLLCNELKNLLEEVQKDLPDVEILFNGLDEPASVITPASMADYRRNVSLVPSLKNMSGVSVWEEATTSCSSPPRKQKSKKLIDDYGIPFVQDKEHWKDLCAHPEYAKQHGLLSGPNNLLLTHHYVPILSQTKPSTFSDVVYPSTYYTRRYNSKAYKEEEDPPWEDKHNTLYWSGSSTGNYATNETWMFGHRQRAVNFANGSPSSSIPFLTRSYETGSWKRVTGDDILKQLYNIHFTIFFQCSESGCAEQATHFSSINGTSGYEAQSSTYASRFTFDLDGNSFSGRFYLLLLSRTLPLKQTIFKEWHDDRVIPWVHYIPVSMSMEELPELMRWLALTEEGGRRAREIAENGRAWAKGALREVDLKIYAYRLVLEMARLMDEGREVEESVVHKSIRGTGWVF